MVDDALFDDGDEVEYGAQGEGGQGDAKQVLAAANQGENGMQQTERIKRGGHAKPDDAHFSHGRIGELESEITVYRGGAAPTGTTGGLPTRRTQRVPLPTCPTMGGADGVVCGTKPNPGFGVWGAPCLSLIH